jgi:hypothetical protein
MSIRKRNDSPKHGMGIDGSLGERYSKTGAVDPWNSNPRGNFISKGNGAYQDADASFLRNVPPNDGTEDFSDARDIFDAVEANQSDSGNRRIKSGKVD